MILLFRKCIRFMVVLGLMSVVVIGCSSNGPNGVPELRKSQSPYFQATKAAGNCLSVCADSPSSGDGTLIANCVFLIPACGIGLVIGFTIDIVVFPILFIDRQADIRRQKEEAEEAKRKGEDQEEEGAQKESEQSDQGDALTPEYL